MAHTSPPITNNNKKKKQMKKKKKKKKKRSPGCSRFPINFHSNSDFNHES